jgi:hypothetical protein
MKLRIPHAMAQFVDAPRYKPDGREFDSRWCHWNFLFRPLYDPGVDSASNRNKYQEYFLGSKDGRCVGLSTLPLSCTDCLEIWEPQPPGTLRAHAGIAFFSSPVQKGDFLSLGVLTAVRLGAQFLWDMTPHRSIISFLGLETSAFLKATYH